VLAAPLQASRFASDWHTAQQSGLADGDEAYWLGQYKTIPDPIELPSDRPRPAAKGYHGARVSRRIDAAAATRVKTFAARQRATLFATLLAAFETLVHRLTGQQDFAIGIPIAGQSLLNGEDLVAHCVSFVPLRSTIDPEHSFAEHLAAVKQRTLAMNEHRSVTIGRLLNCLRIKRDVSRYTLVSVSFTLERAVENLEFHGLDARLLELPRAGSKRDLELNLVEGADGITIAADLDTDLYDPASVERWLESYLRLLEHAIEDPTTPLARLPMVSAGERRLLESWNATAREWPESERTIDELIARVTAAGPARVAVVAEGGTLTYRALNARANQLARHLRCIGTRPGDIVGLAVERSFDMVVGVLGILKAGAAYLPLDPAFPEKRLDYMLADSGAQVLITHRDLARKFATAPTIVRLDAEAAAIASQSERDLEPSAGGPARLAYVLYTSGSTGRPKGVAISHGALRNLLESVRVTPGFTAADTMLAVTTLSFDIAGLEVFLPLLCGGRLVVADRSQIHSPDDLIALIETSRCTVMQATPTLWRTLIEAGWSGTPELRVLCGGEQLPGDLAAQLLRRCGELWNMYGPTETTIYSTGRRITNAETVDIGRPLPNTDVWVLDSRRELAPIGVEGELCIGGAGLAQGYVGQPLLTEERFVPHPFKPGARLYRTGDRARWLIGGSLQCLGRLDTQVKLRGFRIELGEIEAALRQVPCVQDAVVLRREDAPGDARLVGYVIGSATPEAIRAHLTQVLPDYAVPAVFVGVEAWPLTPNGKIDRKVLPAPAANRSAHQENFVAPRTPTEERLAALWRRVLGIEQIGLSDDFFLLGGHSLLAMQVVHNVHREFGLALAPAALFQHSTLEALARHIERGSAEARTAVDDNVLVQLHRGGRGAPFFWVHGIGGGVFGYLKLSEHLGRSRPVYGFAADWTQLAGEVEPTVEAMAARYVRDMRAVQPTGPYHLGGFCTGAILALEMARQLEAAGEHVGVLAALDSVIEPQRQPDSWLPSALQTSMAFARNLPRWLMEDALIAGPVELIGRMRSHLRLIAATRRARGGVAPTDDVRDALGMWRFPDHQARMLKVHHDAMQRYVPRPIAGTVCVFLPRTAPLLRPALPAPAATGWEKLARGAFEVRVVQGSHATMMVEPFATSLGQLLDACVAQCERQPVPAAESPNRVTRAASIVQALTGALIAAFM
jgi:amino acid adenylation domain-containing protein